MRFSSSTYLLLFNGLLVALGAYLGGSLMSAWLHQQIISLPVPPSHSVSLEKPKISQDKGQLQEEFRIILARNIFSAQKEEIFLPSELSQPELTQPENTQSSEIEHTRLAIALAGTMIYSKKNAFAFISKADSLHEYIIYNLGECFNAKTIQRDKECGPESVKILEIKDRWILILYKGKKQALWMIDASQKTVQNPQSKSQSKNRVKSNSPQKATALIVPPKQNVAIKKPVAAESPAEGQTTFHFQRVWVDEQLANFQQLLNDARVVPTSKDGKPYFMFQYIKEQSIYEKLGLKKDDIILEINGFLVDTVGKALKLLETLQSEREIVLKVERKGTPIQFQYFID